MAEQQDDKVIGRNFNKRLNQLETEVNLLRVAVLQLRELVKELFKP